MSGDSFKDFLQNNAAPVPAEPLGEQARVWRHIEGQQVKTKRWLWVLGPSLVAGAMALVFMVTTEQGPKVSEEAYLYQEWESFSRDVDADVDQEVNILFAAE